MRELGVVNTDQFGPHKYLDRYLAKFFICPTYKGKGKVKVNVDLYSAMS